MNRKTLWLNISIALVLILIAAFAGQMHKWQKQQRQNRRSTTSTQPTTTEQDSEDQEMPRRTEILVRFKAGVTQQTIEGITSRLNDDVEDRIEAVDGLEVIEDEDNKSADEVVTQYRALAEVEYAEVDNEIRLDHDSSGKHVHANDELFFKQWGLFNHGQDGGKFGADISAMRAWAVTKGSDQIVVAVLDSGVDYTHPDLANNIWRRPEIIKSYQDEDLTAEGPIDDVNGFNVAENSSDPMDDNGHGTHCAGILGAEGGNEVGIAGVNWTVKIMPLKFMDAEGMGTTSDAIKAINYVINRKRAGVNVRIISASWGSTVRSRALEDVIRKAGDEGILVVAAAGNNSSDNDRTPHYPASYQLNNVISVAAVNRYDELTSFSNYGANSVHVAAPGEAITSTWLNHDFSERKGTSMATPFVAGVAALVLATNPSISVDEWRTRLLSSVDALPALKGKVATGGRINAAKAVGADSN
ncbi:MAG TPA: S8 family peptidase [Pyrinomonadaceae bacterium]|nr:S8 family peptidase [Pyrinomonadaceae bacterium]